MVRKIANLFLTIAFVASLLAVKSSSSSPIQNEVLEELKAELKSLRVKVDLLESKNAENEAKIGLQEAKNVQQENEIIKLKTKMDAKLECDHSAGHSNDENNVIYSNELNSEHSLGALIDERPLHSIESKDIGLLNSQIGGSTRDSSTRAIVPSSCRELAIAGHSIDGLYLVQNSDSRKIEAVFCDFGTSVAQELVGTVDIKTTIAHFYVQRNTPFSTGNAVIPFELARLNEGGAFDLTSGTFTVPVKGIYHFQFSAVKSEQPEKIAIFLQVNGVHIGVAGTTQPSTGSYDAVSLSASFRLNAGDRVNLLNCGSCGNTGMLYDYVNDHWTHFSGWLVEEDLM